METLNFKTNLTSGNDIEAVTLNLNAIEQVDGWNVDTTSPDNLLTVQTTDNRIADLVKQAIMKAGFQADLIDKPV
ncbi:copper chaperone [Fibrella forsythiae]|uniref:Copper chaperone n=1 Tax=Fibrella forsythiae TaxID=2817061 RepID=A0ABS3JLY6_9BACT|nr:copper chaperone [Fibrella forsythiae]MBO0951025.1 copper chaperone [Fibrella forsythiae]